MVNDEADEPRAKAPPVLARPLDGLGVAELERYIGELRTEIGRAEAEIARKRALREAALGVFKGR